MGMVVLARKLRVAVCAVAVYQSEVNRTGVRSKRALGIRNAIPSFAEERGATKAARDDIALAIGEACTTESCTPTSARRRVR
jgi:hypothetical protein